MDDQEHLKMLEIWNQNKAQPHRNDGSGQKKSDYNSENGDNSEK